MMIPPGWYPDPVSGAMRWWDGTRWLDPVPIWAREGGRPKRRRSAAFVRTIVGIVVVLVVAVILVVPFLVGNANDLPPASDFEDRLLTAEEHGEGWRPVEAWEAGTPLGDLLADSATALHQVCPEQRSPLQEELAYAGRRAAQDEVRSVVRFTGQEPIDAGRPLAGTSQSIAVFRSRTESDRWMAALEAAKRCAGRWEVTGPDGTTFSVEHEVVDAPSFGPDVLVTRTTYTPAAAPPGETTAGSEPTSFVDAISQDGDSVMQFGTEGLSDDEAAELFVRARAKASAP